METATRLAWRTVGVFPDADKSCVLNAGCLAGCGTYDNRRIGLATQLDQVNALKLVNRPGFPGGSNS